MSKTVSPLLATFGKIALAPFLNDVHKTVGLTSDDLADFDSDLTEICG